MELCLVTGASGFNGSHMAELLVEEGYRVLATDIREPEPGLLPKEVEFVKADLTDRGDVGRLFAKKPTLAFHPAAVFDYSASWSALKKANVDAMEVLCDAVSASDVKRFVCWSTMGVYGPPENRDRPADETHPKRPANDYERSKWEQEKIGMRRFHNDKLPIVIVRPAPVYGPRSLYGFADMLFKLAPLPLVPVPINMKNRVICVHVRDVTGAALHLAEAGPECLGEAYNAVDDSRLTVSKMTAMVARLLDKKTVPVVAPPANVLKAVGRAAADVSEFVAKYIVKGRPLIERSIVDYVENTYWFANDKIKAAGYRFKYPDCEEGLRETVEWYREKGLLKKSLF